MFSRSANDTNKTGKDLFQTNQLCYMLFYWCMFWLTNKRQHSLKQISLWYLSSNKTNYIRHKTFEFSVSIFKDKLVKHNTCKNTHCINSDLDAMECRTQNYLDIAKGVVKLRRGQISNLLKIMFVRTLNFFIRHKYINCKTTRQKCWKGWDRG